MKYSPLASKILSAYAIIFAGIFPAILSSIGLVHGISPFLIGNVFLNCGIVYFGCRVFRGDSDAINKFAMLVVLHYLGITASNYIDYSDFPTDSRAYEMAVPRMVRGLLFACVFGWYYLLRHKTKEDFEPIPLPWSEEH